MEKPRIFRFEVFEFNATSGELQRDGRKIQLQPQSAGLLHLLLVEAGATISRERIKESLWNADITVDFESGINRCIRELRRILRDDVANPRYIQTIARRGYRFLVPVSSSQIETSSTIHTTSLGTTSDGLFSLVVLPFVNFSADAAGDEYFCDGLTEEVINVLAQIPALNVIARTSAFMFKGKNEDARAIGKMLGTSHIVEGSVRRIESQVRVTVQLIRSSDGVHCLSKRYDHEWAHLFAIQDEIAKDVADQLRLQLGSPQRVYIPKFAAYEAFLEGRYHFRRLSSEGLEKALKCFQRAAEFDPCYSRPHWGIAEYWIAAALEYAGRPVDLLSRAQAAALRAVALDQNDAEAHAALASVLAMLDFDWPAAGKHFTRACELGQQSGVHIKYAYWYLLPRGDLEHALTLSDQMLKADPLLLIGHCLKASVLLSMRDYEAAAAPCRRALEINPEFTHALRLLVILKVCQKQFVEAHKLASELIKRKGRCPVGLDALGMAHASAGDRLEAYSVIEELKRSPTGQNGPSRLANIHAILGEHDKALDCLETAVQLRDGRVLWMLNLPWFDSIRSTPRYKSLLKTIQLA
jgi:TolB-like protein/Tfp pilus assembly protein PilF